MRHRHLVLAAFSLMLFACSGSGDDDGGPSDGVAGGVHTGKGKTTGSSNGTPSSDDGAGDATPSPTPTGTTPAPAPTTTGTSAPTPVPTTTGTSMTPPPMPQQAWTGSAPKGSVPVTGGTLVVSNGTAIAADPDRDMVTLVDLASQTVRAQISLPSGAEPGRVAVDVNGRAHVILRRGGGIADIDLASGTLLGLRQTCALPRGIAYYSLDDSLLVSCLTGDLLKLSTDPSKKTPLLTTTLTVSGQKVTDLRDVFVKADSPYVTTFRSAQMYKLDSKLNAVSEPVTLNTRADTSAAQLAANGMSGGTPQNYVPMVAWRTVIGPNGDFVVVHEAGTDRVIDISEADDGSTQQTTQTVCSSSGYGGSTCTTTSGTPICTPPIVVGLVSSVTDDGTVYDGPAIPEGALPVDIVASPDGHSYTVVLAGNRGGATTSDGAPILNVVSVPAISQQAGPAGNAAAFDGDLCGLSFAGHGVSVPGQPTSVALDAQGQAVVQTREPATLQYLTAGGVVAISLSPASVQNDGFDLFHDNTGRGLACASCHAEGQDDGRTWKFTPGLDASGNPTSVLARRTQTFRAGFLDTAPFHWDGEFSGMPALMSDVFIHRMAAAAEPSAEQEAALEQWMNGIPAKMHDAPSAALATSIANGKALFEADATGCTGCHGGPNFTDNKSDDIGFGYGTQTPSLVDVAFRAPYLHDGSVATLAARFTDPTAMSGNHGTTSQLSQDQLGDLIHYLESL